jgi:hypothetical protein
MPNDPTQTTPDRAPAEVFHPSVFILEEMEARGWDQWELSRRMGGDAQINYVGLEFYFEIGPIEPDLRLGDGEDFARAFGTSAEFWRNLEDAWLRWPNRRSA